MEINRKPLGKQYKSLDVKEYTFDKESRTISGYAAIFGNVDKASDMLIRGCFDKSIRDRGPESRANDKIVLLWMHKTAEPLGRITKLEEDEKGLYFEAAIDKIELGDRALIQLESGTINQFSIGYEYVWSKCEWAEINGERVFVVKEVILYEISPVSIGCNGETVYTGLKSQKQIDDAYNELQYEINEVLSEYPINKRSSIQSIVSKTWSLAQIKPEKPIDSNKPNLLTGIKFSN